MPDAQFNLADTHTIMVKGMTKTTLRRCAGGVSSGTGHMPMRNINWHYASTMLEKALTKTM